MPNTATQNVFSTERQASPNKTQTKYSYLKKPAESLKGNLDLLKKNRTNNSLKALDTENQ